MIATTTTQASIAVPSAIVFTGIVTLAQVAEFIYHN